MKIAVFVLAVVLAAQAADFRVEAPDISIVGSARQPVDDAKRVKLAFELAQSALGRRQLPHIHMIFVYVDKDTGRKQDVPKNTDVFIVHLVDTLPSTYYVWIVGGANDDRLATGVIGVLNREWQLKLDKQQSDAAVHRVRLALSGVVSTNELAGRD